MSSREYMKLYLKEYYKKNKEKLDERSRRFRKENPEKRKITCKNYREKTKQHQKEYERNYRKTYPEKGRARLAKRRATKLQQTPKWADLNAIEEFYKNCPDGFHVDHIIPLQGRNVRGLHVLENLQYLPATENISKGNKYEL